MKPKMPFGSLPVLDHAVKDGTVRVAESGAIARYIAEVTNIRPKNPADAARADMVYEACRSIRTNLQTKVKHAGGSRWIFPKFAANVKAQTEAVKEQFADEGPMKTALTNIEKLYPDASADGGVFLLGKALSLADIGVVIAAELFKDLGQEKFLDGFPKLKAAYEGALKMGTLGEFLSGVSGSGAPKSGYPYITIGGDYEINDKGEVVDKDGKIVEAATSG